MRGRNYGTSECTSIVSVTSKHERMLGAQDSVRESIVLSTDIRTHGFDLRAVVALLTPPR